MNQYGDFPKEMGAIFGTPELPAEGGAVLTYLFGTQRRLSVSVLNAPSSLLDSDALSRRKQYCVELATATRSYIMAYL